MTLKSVMEDLSKSVKLWDEFIFHVRRDHILVDSLRAVEQHDFHHTKCIKVKQKVC